MMRAAFALLEHVKASGVTGRRFSGVATSPEVDRVGDVIEMSGVKFAPEVPLLLHHDHRAPVGVARLGPVTPNGIRFEAEIPEIDEPGETKERCDSAAAMVRTGLLRAVSIGFRVLESAVDRLPNGGARFLKIEILELSIVAVPANAQATITNIRAIVFGRGLEPVDQALPVVRMHAPVTPPARKPWTPPTDVNYEWAAAWRKFYRTTGIEPATYRHDERQTLAYEQWKHDPLTLTDQDIAHLAYQFPEEGIQAYKDRDKARLKSQAVSVEHNGPGTAPDKDEFFVTRKVLNDTIAALTKRIADLEAKLKTKSDPPAGPDYDAIAERVREAAEAAINGSRKQ